MGTSGKQQNKVPQLRFYGFNGEWQEKRLEDLFFEFKSGFGITASNISKSGQYPVYGGNGLRGYTETTTHSGNYFLIGRQGALCGNIVGVNGDFYASEHAIVAEANNLNDTSWLGRRLDFYNLNRLSESSAQPGLSVAKLKRIKLIVPELEEQQKIADFLGSVDAWLDNLRGQKTALQSYKQGMLQKLFSGQVRFKDVGGNNFPDWEEKELGDVSVKSSSGVAAGSLEGNTGDYAVYGASGLYKHVDFYQEEEPYIAIIKDGSGVGRAAIYPGKSSVISTLNVLRATSGNDLYFVYLLLLRLNLLKYVIGGAIPHIYYKDYRREKIMVPVREEQQKIADFLTALDQTITAKADEITKVEEWKKGLMQKMFV
jgi:type I restriction enzyme S subunit